MRSPRSSDIRPNSRLLPSFQYLASYELGLLESEPWSTQYLPKAGLPMGLEADGCSPDVLNPVCEYESPLRGQPTLHAASKTG
jgi:hypothetical protein